MFNLMVRGVNYSLDDIYADLIGPDCSLCGYPIVYGLGYLHTDCENFMVHQEHKLNMTDLEKKREQFNKTIKQIRKRIFDRDGQICHQCGSINDLTIDHIVPLSKGGANEDSNYQVLCRHCNTMKGTR